MASSSFVNISEGTAAAYQGVNQFSVGFLLGGAVDMLCETIPYGPGDLGARIGRQVIQVSLNALAINVALRFLHGDAGSGYRDPSGGYFLGFGLICGQPGFWDNNRGLAVGTMQFIGQKINSVVPENRPEVLKT